MTVRTALFRFALATLAIGLTAGPAPANENAKEPAALALGAKAPRADVKMKNIDGKELTIAGAKGEKGTLVLFTCNACPWVKRWEDRIARLGNEYMGKGVGVIAINANDPAVNAEDSYAIMQERAREKGFRFPYVVDATSDVARAFGATRTPEAFLFDAQGRLVYHGTVDDNAQDAAAVKTPYLGNALAAVVAGKPVPEASTKALGCGIKFRGGPKGEKKAS
jgi:peroxiredoxin